jgi:nucleoside-diphosphate-sugar epimerase
MRILITGASGFIGRQVLSALRGKGVPIHAVSRRCTEDASSCVWHEADLLAPGVAGGLIGHIRPTHVIHLAWCVEHGRFWTDPANLDFAAATFALARACAEHRVVRFVAAGTCYEYDWPEDANCSETTTPLAGHSLYDISKDACRRALTQFFDLQNIEFAWARLFFLYGAFETASRLVASLARALVNGEPALCSPGRAIRDFIDVRDAGQALAALTLGSPLGPINIATGEAVTIADLAMMLGRLAGRPALVQLGALPDRAGDPPRIVADISRLRGELLFQPAHSLETGLADALSFWSEQRPRL